MKKLILFVAMLGFAASVSAQNPKFGHLNLEEVVALTSEMDSASAILERYSKELQETLTAMQNELYTKYNNYQQMNANWTPAVLQAKQQEIQELEQRIQTFQQNAQQEMAMKQQELIAPIMEMVNKAIAKVGKDGGYSFIFSTTTNVFSYYDESQCTDVTDQVKNELNIPLDKVLRQPEAAAPAAN